MIEALVLSFALVLARVGAFVGLLPIFGGPQVPRVVKVGISVALVILCLGSEGTIVPASLAALPVEARWLAYGLLLGRETVIGLVLGYAFSLFLVPARIAGEYIASEMGLTLGGLVDPTGDHSASVVTQVLETAATLLFLGLDAHHVLLAALYGTFQRWPVGTLTAGLPLDDLVGGTAAVQEWGLLLAAPVGVCLFLTSVVLALLSRLAPQVNVFNTGFAVRVGVGLGALVLLLPGMAAGLVSAFSHFAQLLQRLV